MDTLLKIFISYLIGFIVASGMIFDIYLENINSRDTLSKKIFLFVLLFIIAPTVIGFTFLTMLTY